MAKAAQVPTNAEGVDFPEIEFQDNAESRQLQGKEALVRAVRRWLREGFCWYRGRRYKVEQVVELANGELVSGVRCSFGKRSQCRASFAWLPVAEQFGKSGRCLPSVADPRMDGL